jgi:hypothetical protein
MSSTNSKLGRNIVWTVVVLLAILHQDFWLWGDKTLLFGFLPIGLAYHIGFSIAAGLTWAFAVKFAWPAHIEEWASEFESKRGASAPVQRGGTH